MAFGGALQYPGAVTGRDCKTCGQYEIRRHFSFRGEGQWQAYLNERGFGTATQRSEAGSQEAYLLACPSCEQVLRLVIKTPDDSELYEATLRHANILASELPLSEAITHFSSDESSSSVVTPIVHAEAESSLSHLTFDFEQFTQAFCRFTTSSPNTEALKPVFAILERVEKENFKLRREYRENDSHAGMTLELWFESGAWLLTLIDCEPKYYRNRNRFVHCKNLDLLLVQLERFVAYSYVDGPSAEAWRGLSTYLVPSDQTDLKVQNPWMSRRVEKIRLRLAQEERA